MIQDYVYELLTGDKYEAEKITSKIVGCLKTICVRTDKIPLGIEVQCVKYPSLIILNDRMTKNGNLFIHPKIRVYNVSEKNEDQNHLSDIYLNDGIYLKVTGQKGATVLITLRCENAA